MFRSSLLVLLLPLSSAFGETPVTHNPDSLRTLVVPAPHCTSAPDFCDNFVAAKGHRVVYLNFEGVTLTRSNTADDAKTGQSAIVTQSSTTIPAFDPSDLWSTNGLSRSQIIAEVIADLEAIHAPYDIEFVTQRPLAGDYSMVVFGGNCGSVAGTSCAGIALRDCGDFMPNNITFVFPPGLRVGDLAVTATQEAAHAFGLGHTNDTSDVMYPYIISSIPNHYGAGSIPDGSGCPSTATYQDSHQLMLDNIGPAGQDVVGPQVFVSSPASGGIIRDGDLITGTATDASGVSYVQLKDGVQDNQQTGSSFSFNVDHLPSGMHTVLLVAEDTKGQVSQEPFEFFRATGDETPCSTASDCGEGLECRDNICVPDNGLQDLGQGCNADSDCSTQFCLMTNEGSACSQPCTGAGGCPSGFECLQDTACFPAGESGGGCQSSPAPLLLVLMAAFVMLFRKGESRKSFD